MRHPIWFLNFCISHEGLHALSAWAPTIHNWLDNTLVSGNADAQAVCRVVLKMYSRFAAFEKLRLDRSDALWPVRNLVMRLRGVA